MADRDAIHVGRGLITAFFGMVLFGVSLYVAGEYRSAVKDPEKYIYVYHVTASLVYVVNVYGGLEILRGVRAISKRESIKGMPENMVIAGYICIGLCGLAIVFNAILQAFGLWKGGP